VSGSEVQSPGIQFGPEWVWRQIRRFFRSIWGVFRQSRLGLAGLSIVLIFAFIALLAPVISPFPRDFTAPDSDRFVIATYSTNLERGLDYNPPVLGPTTPLSDDKLGGVWVIDSATQGRIFMDFTQYTLGSNESPFERGGRRLILNVSDFSASVQPDVLTPPLTAVYYIIPGQNLSATGLGTLGGVVSNGALGFFSGREFVAASPFSKSVFFHYPLPFVPTWTGEDPASAGEMLVIPAERQGGQGLNVSFVGPYRYFTASDGNHTLVFEIQYVHEGDAGALVNNQLKIALPGGHVALAYNGTLSAPPFVLYNPGFVDSYDSFRSGIGQAIVLPLVNDSLLVYNVSGKARAWVPLSLDGQPAHVVGSIGYLRAPEEPPVLFLPLRSSAEVGLGVLDMSRLRIANSFSLPHPNWEPIGLPTSYVGGAGGRTFLGFYDPVAESTLFLGFTGQAAPIPQVNWTFMGRLQTFFEVQEVSKVFLYSEAGRIFSLATSFSGLTTVTPVLYALQPPSNRSYVLYAGTPAGTLYGGGLSQQEMHGIWTDSQGAETTLFQLLGTSRTPLPPGTYTSGNRYLLGTNFKGEDILTQLFYGTQVAFIVGLLAALFTVGIGTVVGLIAGFFGKIIDTLLMRTTDIFLVLPFLPIVLILDAILRPSIWTIILVISIVGWPGIARVIRAQVLSLRERPFIDAARVSGASDWRLIFRHIAPNVLPFSFLYMSLTVSGAIITEAALSFLGLGDARVISWGGMLSQVLTFGGALSAWWWLIPPGLSITFLSLGFYLMGRGFDEIINPRLRKR